MEQLRAFESPVGMESSHNGYTETHIDPLPSADAIVGCLLGTAIGDAIGLPAEGLPKARLNRMYPHLDRHRFLFGRGMTSDDTEHTRLVAQSLICSAGDIDAFSASFARQLRLWFLGLPAGMGLATLKACVRLLIGYAPAKSGVFSAGNGPAMRSAILGVCFGGDTQRLRELVRASTRITHTDPNAEHGALAVAAAAHMAARGADPKDYCETLDALLGTEAEELISLVRKAASSTSADKTTASFAEELGYGRGVSGYVYATVPIALHAWFRNPGDYRAAVREVILCGGDTDTTAAIVGGILGAGLGKQGIPQEWIDGLAEWPCSIAWMQRLGARLAEVLESQVAQRPLPISQPQLIARNVLFLAVVLLHGFRRLLPPY